MTVIEDYPRLTFLWDNATIGTPPYSMGFNFGPSTNSGDLDTMIADVSAYWASDTVVLGYLSNQLGPLTLVAQGIYGGNAIEESSSGHATATGSDPDLPGVSVRFKMTGNRPVGGRYGSMYLPCLEGAGADADGVINTTYLAELTAWGEGLCDAVEASVLGCTVKTLHSVNGVDSVSTVTSMVPQSTVSFLNRRYR